MTVPQKFGPGAHSNLNLSSKVIRHLVVHISKKDFAQQKQQLTDSTTNLLQISERYTLRKLTYNPMVPGGSRFGRVGGKQSLKL